MNLKHALTNENLPKSAPASGHPGLKFFYFSSWTKMSGPTSNLWNRIYEAHRNVKGQCLKRETLTSTCELRKIVKSLLLNVTYAYVVGPFIYYIYIKCHVVSKARFKNGPKCWVRHPSF